MQTEIIFGAPGCGKTTKLMQILDTELKQHSPDRIAFVSFTRKGAYEGRDRACEKFGYKADDFPYFRTLHSIAFREGNYSMAQMISKKDYKHFSDAMGMKFTGYYTEEFYNNDDVYLFLCFLKRNNEKAFNDYLEKHPYFDITTLTNVIKNYERYKQEYNIVDFTDIIETFLQRKQQLPVDIAIIDEAQDLTSLQWLMCGMAFSACKKVYIAGDDDQSIYEWNGADIGTFLHLRGVRTVLDKSYRLKKSILEFSKKITARMTERVDKIFDPIDDGGEITFINEVDDLPEFKPDDTYYLLARNNWFLRFYRSMLMKRGHVFHDKEKLSYDKNVVDAINAFERARKSKNTSELTKYVQLLNEKYDLNTPWYLNFMLPLEQVDYYRKLIQNKTDLNNVNITVSTIHGVKGGEADNVVFLMDFTKACLENFNKNMDSELRCLYVAFTRAKNTLTLVHSTTSNGYDREMRF